MELKVIYFPDPCNLGLGHVELYAYPDSDEDEVTVCAYSAFPQRERAASDILARKKTRQFVDDRIREGIEAERARVVDLVTEKITYDGFWTWCEAQKKDFNFALFGNNCSDIVRKALIACGFLMNTNTIAHYVRSFIATVLCVSSLRGGVCLPFSTICAGWVCSSWEFPVNVSTPGEIFALAEAASEGQDQLFELRP